MRFAMSYSMTVLGTRGSFPVNGKNYNVFGGSTTAFLLELNGEPLIIDAGSGLQNLPEHILQRNELSLLLTHFHADHLLGLLLFNYLLDPAHTLHIYAEQPEGCTAADSVSRLFSPPLWPLALSEVPAKICWHGITPSFQLGNFVIETLPGNHPGGVTIYKLTAEKRSVVIATDCTINTELRESLKGFAADCELLLCDGQYSESEWETHKSYGHSTWNMATQLALECRAKKMRIVHHSPFHTDEQLLKMEQELLVCKPSFSFAREGETIVL